MSYNRINITNWLFGESENPHQTAVKWSRGAANLNLFLFSDLGVKATKSENKKRLFNLREGSDEGAA